MHEQQYFSKKFISVAHPIKREQMTVYSLILMRLLDLFIRASLCSIKYFVVKALIEKKNSPYPNQKAPLPNPGNLPPGWERMI